MWDSPEGGPRLKIKVTAAAEQAVRQGHPWVYGDKVRQQNRPAGTGEIAILYDRADRFLALGFYDLESAIRLRIIHRGRPAQLDEDWWQEKFAGTIAKRAALFDGDTTGYRLINGENDGWPALILDRFGDHLVLKIYAGFWLPFLPRLQSIIQQHLQPRSIMLRLSRNLIARAAKDFSLSEGFLGEEGPDIVTFLENGLRFEAEIRFGQKTGFFLDQRENRQRVEALARDQDVLNAFSFSGGFSLYAARGGARSVTDLDISPHALESARRNFVLNHHIPSVAATDHRGEQTDAFAWLAQAARPGGPRFGLVITDPPSLARREAERSGGIDAYHHLALQGLQLLKPSGTLLAASCSAHVSAGEFRQAVERAARIVLGSDWRALWTAGHAPDHPVSFPEGEYLKAIAIQRT